MKSLRTWAAMLAAVLVPATAAAQNVVVNPSFEAGSLVGWTQAGPTCTYESLQAGDTSAGAAAVTAPAPSNGTFLFVSDALAPGSCTFFQDVVVTSPVNTFAFSAGYQYVDFGDPTGAGCSATVAATDVAGTRTYASFPIGTGSAPVAFGPRSGTFSAAPGSTVRIIATFVSCAGGPVSLALDNFVVAAAPAAAPIPTLGEWAMLLLFLLMTAIAAAKLRRRGAVTR